MSDLPRVCAIDIETDTAYPLTALPSADMDKLLANEDYEGITALPCYFDVADPKRVFPPPHKCIRLMVWLPE